MGAPRAGLAAAAAAAASLALADFRSPRLQHFRHSTRRAHARARARACGGSAGSSANGGGGGGGDAKRPKLGGSDDAEEDEIAKAASLTVQECINRAKEVEEHLKVKNFLTGLKKKKDVLEAEGYVWDATRLQEEAIDVLGKKRA